MLVVKREGIAGMPSWVTKRSGRRANEVPQPAEVPYASVLSSETLRFAMSVAEMQLKIETFESAR